MKTTLFFIATCMFNRVIIGDIPEKFSIPCTLENEISLRCALYKTYNEDSYFHQNDDCEFFQNVDFYITILTTHINKLHSKIAQQRWLYNCRDMRLEYGLRGVSILSACLSYLFFTHCSWPKKKDYFIEYINDWKSNAEYEIKNMFQQNYKQQFFFLERYNEAKYNHDEFHHILCAVGLPLISCLCAIKAISLYFKFKSYRSSQSQWKKIERDEQLLAIFKEKKQSLHKSA